MQHPKKNIGKMLY